MKRQLVPEFVRGTLNNVDELKVEVGVGILQSFCNDCEINICYETDKRASSDTTPPTKRTRIFLNSLT